MPPGRGPPVDAVAVQTGLGHGRGKTGLAAADVRVVGALEEGQIAEAALQQVPYGHACNRPVVQQHARGGNARDIGHQVYDGHAQPAQDSQLVLLVREDQGQHPVALPAVGRAAVVGHGRVQDPVCLARAPRHPQVHAMLVIPEHQRDTLLARRLEGTAAGAHGQQSVGVPLSGPYKSSEI